jgi:hypothetical protein
MKYNLAMLFIVIMAAGLLIAASDIVLPVFADKNPQAECIKGQNEAFIGKEQSGDAYKSSKDTCQELSK